MPVHDHSKAWIPAGTSTGTRVPGYEIGNILNLVILVLKVYIVCTQCCSTSSTGTSTTTAVQGRSLVFLSHPKTHRNKFTLPNLGPKRAKFTIVNCLRLWVTVGDFYTFNSSPWSSMGAAAKDMESY